MGKVQGFSLEKLIFTVEGKCYKNKSPCSFFSHDEAYIGLACSYESRSLGTCLNLRALPASRRPGAVNASFAIKLLTCRPGFFLLIALDGEKNAADEGAR